MKVKYTTDHYNNVYVGPDAVSKAKKLGDYIHFILWL